MACSFVEGIDDEVLLSFVVLLVIMIASLLYFFKTNSNAIYNPSNLSHIFGNTTAEGAQSDATSGSPPPNTNSYSESRESIPQSTESVENPSASSSSGGQSGSFVDGLRRRTGDVEYTESSPPSPSNAAQTEGTGEQRSDGSARISLRIKHHENERNFGVDPNITVRQLKQLCFPDEVARGRRVRLIFSGRLINDDNASISFYGVNNFSVIHAQISDVSEPVHPAGDAEVELDVSRLFIPLVTAILCVCWYGLLTYGQLFNATSTAILVIVTAAYAFMLCAMIG